MATPQELLRKLDERFVLGEISEEQYRDLRPRLQAQADAAGFVQAGPDAADEAESGGGEPVDAPATAGGMDISDSVIKGNVTSGSASVGNINIHLGGQGGAGGHAGELEYEKFVLLVLRSGGQLDTARKELDERRLGLGLSIRLAKEIEVACLEACGRLPAGTHSPAAPASAAPAASGSGAGDALSRFFRSASDSLTSMFATPQSVQPTGPVQGAPAAPGGVPPPKPPPAMVPPPPPPSLGRSPVIQGTPPLSGPVAPSAKPPALAAALKADMAAAADAARREAVAELDAVDGETGQDRPNTTEQDSATARPPPLFFGTPPPLPHRPPPAKP